MATTEGESMTFRDKKKFFEEAIEDHVTGKKVASGRKFSYLQEHEVANLRSEEDLKKSSMTEDELTRYLEDKLVTADVHDSTDYNKIITSSVTPSSPSTGSNIRTAKAERRFIEKYNKNNRRSSEPNSSPMSDCTFIRQQSPEEREMETEKRTAWRKARMDSLMQDTATAQAVLNKSHEIQQQNSLLKSECRSGH